MLKEYKFKGVGFAFVGLLFGLTTELLLYQLTSSNNSSFLAFLNLTPLHRFISLILLSFGTLSGLISGHFYSHYKEQKNEIRALKHQQANLRKAQANTEAELAKAKQALNQDSGMFVSNWDELVKEKERYREEASIRAALLEVTINISSLKKQKNALKILSQVLPVVLYADACVVFTKDENGNFQWQKVVLPKNLPGIKKLLTQKQPLAINPEDKEKLLTKEIINQLKLQSALFIPCITKDEVIAVAAVLYTKSPFELDKKEIKIASGIAKQVTVVLENAQLYQEVLAQHQELQLLLEKLAAAQEDERRRIARDLHDSIIQDLSGIIFALSFLSNALPVNEIKAHQEIEQLTKVVEATVQSIRQIIYDLRPTTLDSLGLIPTLEKYLERFATQQKVKVEFKSDLKQRLPEKIETAVFRLTQEALNNIAKYAQAKNVTVNINQEKNVLAVSIKDDGIGFDLNEVQKRASQSSGFGLSGMRERVRIINGNFQIKTAPGQGCQLMAVIPLEPLERKEQNGANISAYR